MEFDSRKADLLCKLDVLVDKMWNYRNDIDVLKVTSTSSIPYPVVVDIKDLADVYCIVKDLIK